MVKLGILSDVHIGFRQYGLESRWEDFNAAFGAALYSFLTQGITNVFVAGDILHQARPTARTMAYMRKLHDWLVQSKMTVYVVPGNHDLTNPHWLTTIVTEGQQHGFRVVDQEIVTVEDNDSVRVFCVGFMAPELFRTAIHDFPEADIIISHQGMVEFTGVKRPQNLTFDDYLPGKYAMAIIGDTHVTRKEDYKGTIFLSPGSTEMNDASEPSEKYLFILDVEKGEILNIDQQLIPTRKVLNYQDVGTKEDVDDLINMVRKMLADNPKERATLVVHYKRECRDMVRALNDLQRQFNIIVRATPMPLTGKDPATFTQAEGRSILEIAQQDVGIPEVQDLLVKIIGQPDNVSSVIDDWVDKHAGNTAA
jgi:DNA repair exonuclease SbcCD nuclease subunit